MLGLSLITLGIVKKSEINSKYSSNSKENIQKQLVEGKTKLETLKAGLENKIQPTEDEIFKLEHISFIGYDDTYYQRQSKIKEFKKGIENDKKSIDVIDKALDDSFN